MLVYRGNLLVGLSSRASITIMQGKPENYGCPGAFRLLANENLCRSFGDPVCASILELAVPQTPKMKAHFGGKHRCGPQTYVHLYTATAELPA